MQLSQYISDLLFRYECVIVPNFGAFLTHNISAQINTHTHSFLPPKKQLSFNRQLQTNDGILANHIANIEQISYDNALAKIAKQVTEINNRVNNGEAVILTHVGTLKKSEAKLQFEPSYEVNYLTESFGLSAFNSPQILRESPLEVVLPKEKSPITLTAKKRRTQSIMRYAAITILALGLGGYLGSNAYINQVEQHNIQAEAEANIALENRIQEATFAVSTPLPTSVLDVKNRTEDFHIVAGAFRVKANSERKLRQLKRLGFKARIIGQNRYGLHQVVYDSYPSREEAQQALYTIKRTQDPTAWLLIKTLK